MPTGFIYVITTVGKDYRQSSFPDVPTWHEGRIYFGPCKKPMRPKMMPGDVVFGLSPSKPFPRRVVFAARLAERLTFAQAYERFPELHGPKGPIHVRPAQIPGPSFPDSEYEHIPGAKHADSWHADLSTRGLDAFFVCEPADDCLGRWLGGAGPAAKGPILEFLRTCQVWGNAGLLSTQNNAATEAKPVRHGDLFTGLHLETDRPDELVRLVCGASARSKPDDDLFPEPALTSPPKKARRSCS